MEIDERSKWEIERWERVINKCGAAGVERMRWYICGRVTARNFMETADSFYQRIGWADFLKWAHPILHSK